MKRWNLAITGFGRIGRSVAELVWQRQPHYRQRYGADVRLVAVCGSRAGCFEPAGLSREQVGTPHAMQPGLTGEAFLARVGADVLIEAGPTEFETGGAALAYLRTALGMGMHAIVISKGALVVDHAGLAALAAAQGVQLKISGATSAALPTIDLLQYNLAGSRILQVEGILTATTNFVLSRLMDGAALAAAVREAQDLGMAEPDPRFDLEGWDTACKIAILANAAFGAGIRLQDVARCGVDRVSAADTSAWREAGVVPKLVGRIVNGDSGVRASVELVGYPRDHPFALVGAGMKAIRVDTDAMGEVIAIGRSGPLATAAAAMKDFEHLLMAASR